MNPAAVTIFGANFIGKKRSDYDVGARYQDGTPIRSEACPALRALETGEFTQGMQLLVRNSVTGNDLPILVNSTRLTGPTGAQVGVVSVCQEISAIRDLEQEREQLLAETETALQRLQAVQAITDTALAHLPAQDLLRQLVARVSQVLGVDNAALLLVTEDGRSLVVYLALGAEEAQEGECIVPIGQGIAGRVAASRQPLIVDDLRCADVANVQLRDSARSLAAVPVLVQDRLVGVLHADSTCTGRFTVEELEVLQLVAERIGLVVENGHLYAEARQRSADLAMERDRLQRILNVLPEGIVVYDADARVVAVNPAAEALLGMDVVGEKRSDIDYRISWLDGTPLPLDTIPSMRALTTGESSLGLRLLMQNAASGRDVPVLTSSVPLRDPEGRVAGAVSMCQDISAIVELERQRDRMLSMVAHDLRNPLASIVGMSQILQLQLAHVDKSMRDRFARCLTNIETAGGRMTVQIGDLLDSTRTQARRPLPMAFEAVEIVNLLCGVLEEHQGATDRHLLELRCAEESVVAIVDRLRLERAVTNLVVNAIKYSPQGGLVVLSVTRSVRPEGRWLNIKVADSGLGIPSADQPHLFEQYYRASNVIAAIPGTGIGLAGVRHIAQSHGGTVTIDSTENVGTTVTLRLPLRQDTEDRAVAVS
jgi:signal transduction histidine kinase/putative methionine-R-sulfoxide reductase with GAF domain